MKKHIFSLLLCGICIFAMTACTQQSQSSDPTEMPSSISESPSQEGDETEPLEQIITITSFDGTQFDGKLRLPENGAIDRVVIYVNSSGPHTYDDHRSSGELEFNYHDLFAEQFTANGIAYFSYNTRGVTSGETPPLYVTIDEEAYQQYKPSNQVKDVECIIAHLSELDLLKDAEIYLLGWSEGTVIAPLVTKGNNVRVDAVLLAGYMNSSMTETIEWQQSGHSSMVNYGRYYDYNQDGVITLEEFTEDQFGLQGYLGKFEELDTTQDGILDASDFALLLSDYRQSLFAAFEGGDDEWLAENYGVRLTSEWYLDHVNLPANSETMLEIALPVHIFHGVYDANVPVSGVYDIEEAYQAAAKDNLTIHIYEDGDHDLNYAEYLTTGEIPAGIRDIIQTCVAGAK